ncbi:MAG TPA: FecR domain-containing protein [Syntrophales bacterium]|nr:FecR domain-containing protein [Syntrophales bacterium]
MNLNRIRKLFVPLATIFTLLSVGANVSPVYASPTIATVQKASGTAAIVRQGQTISATVGLEIRENDTLRTGPDGSIGVIFRDDTLLSLGPESALVIDKFVFAPKEGKFSIILRMIRGTAAYLSGLISKLAPDSAHFETPTASIGIRGTKFVVRVEGK